MAKIFLNNETFTVGANGTADSFGATGTTEKLVVAAGATVTADQNIERIELSGASSAYGYSVSGNVVTVKLGTATVATYTVGNGDKTIAFADGSAALVFNKLNDVTLGGKAIATTSGALTGLTLDAADKSASATGSTVAAPTTKLTTGQDFLAGTSANDTFTGIIINNSNTLQSGDSIDGGEGTDTLRFDVGNSQGFTITAETVGVENVVIRAQTVSTDKTDNNTASTSEVQIDAERMPGVNYWENSNSRADLLIEDVRILPAQITKDITIAMVETDPGHVDFGFYFDQYSLRSQTSNTSTLTLELADTRSLAAGGVPLKDNPYWGFKFLVGGVEKSVLSQAIDEAQTYPQLLTAISAALAANPDLVGITAALGAPIARTDTISGQAVQIIPIILSNSGPAALTPPTGGAWLAQNGVPASSGLHTNMSNTAVVSTEKVTSKVILDDVGRGSTGGDLVIGGLSVGDTSNSLGVERFEIEVRDNNKLQTINSTNNTLEEVVIKNGATSSSSFAYATTTANKGNLTVNGDVSAPKGNSNVDANLPASIVSANGATTAYATATAYGASIDTALPGSAAQHNAYGFSDVRLIDGSAMTGKLEFTAEITARSIAKYMNLVDTQANPASDALNGFGTGNAANFDYKGGAGNDTFVVDINSDVAGSRSSLVSGREDFTFTVNGGAGDDAITLRVVNALDKGNTENWYNNQDLNNNIAIFGGEGNDTITKPGAGDVKIDGGAGNDVIYADNTGAQTIDVDGATGYGNANATVVTRGPSKAVWVFNTTDQTNTANILAVRDIGDLRSDTNESYNFFNSKVTVNFKGIPAVTVGVAGTGFKTTDLELNQAIKSAINNDAVLSKLLVAEDGPANSLVVKSLIDGAMTTANLSITVSNGFVLPADISASQLTSIGAVYGLTAANSTAANVHAAMNTALGVFTTNADYVTALANDGTSNITGAASGVTSSDNLILPGSGNDVVVLGTTTGATIAAASSDTVVIASAFGNDTVVNFVAGAGVNSDAFDFNGLFTGSTATSTVSFGGALTNHRSINVGTVVTSATVTEAAAVAALFTANNAVAQEHVYVAVNSHNVGYVYTVADPIGATNATVILQGSIDLADTAWNTLTPDNFVNSSVANYFLEDGPTNYVAAAPVAPVAPVAAGTNPVTINAAGTYPALSGVDQFTVVLGSYAATISNFAAGDKIVAPAGTGVTVTQNLANSSFTDGQANLVYASASTGQVTTITLTGLSAAQDASLFQVSGLNDVFGAGTV